VHDRRGAELQPAARRSYAHRAPGAVKRVTPAPWQIGAAARDAEPKSEEEKHAMQKAERIGKQRARK